jgi:hypothetical protein
MIVKFCRLFCSNITLLLRVDSHIALRIFEKIISYAQTVGKDNILRNLLSNKKPKAPIFQVLLLDNDANEDIEVQEATQVDFLQVKEHLRNGGSVFITTKDSQKMVYPKTKAQLNYNRSRRSYGALFRQHLRSS